MRPLRDLLTGIRKRLSRDLYQNSGDDGFFYPGESSTAPRDRSFPVFRNVIEGSLRAWREDALARRIVSLMTQYSVGRGFLISADDLRAEKIIYEFWNHPLNRMAARLPEWSDELCRTGNLFIMLSSDISGMTYVRAIPAGQIEEIVSMENDIEQPLFFRLREAGGSDHCRFPEEKVVPGASLIDGDAGERMLHFTVNRPVGGQWGEPDLAPVLHWLGRYRTWLEDRVRLNHYRSCFLYHVRTGHSSEQMRKFRQDTLNAKPIPAGMIFVTGMDEEWSVIQPSLESSDANEDGFAIKKMIAAGVGIPVSFLAEPAGTSRAESGGMEDSACRNFRQRQQALMFIIETVLRHVLLRAARVRGNFDPDCGISVYGDDIMMPGMSEGGIINSAAEGLSRE